jgi:hypothetical protein
VVIVADKGPESRERGKIGRVSEVRQKQREVVIEDMNLVSPATRDSQSLRLEEYATTAAGEEARLSTFLCPLQLRHLWGNQTLTFRAQVDIATPSYLQAIEPSAPAIRTAPLPIPLSSIRLVYPIESNGTTEDHIIERLVRIPGRRGGRFIANSDAAVGGFIEIPRPEEKKERTESKTEDADTLRFEVEEATWTPTLLRAPMPGAVIDELRNKYGKHRTRHDAGYLLAMQNREKRKAEWEAWAKSGGGMLMTPAKEARQKERAEMAAKGKPELKRELLERIGEVMAQKGISLTEERQRELERNLMTEDVLAKERAKVLAQEKAEMAAAKKVKAEIVEDERFEDGELADGELEEEMERLGVDEVRVVEVDEPPRRSPPSV